jgi:replicative DNA helicase
MAIEFNCIVILTTQLNKEAIKRPDHRPTPVDSKNSSGQSEAASYWFGIKRISQWDNGTRYPDSNLVELIVGKNRNDELEGIVYFETENSLYLDIDQNRALQLVLQSDLNRKAEIKRFDNLFNKGKKQ